jgi:predicted enzyme related to lactoylglutathione lyase
MFLGLRSLIYPAPDLDTAKAWYTKALGVEPYFDEPFYVGYDVGGYELGLNPDGDPAGPRTYWGVADIDSALSHLLDLGATLLDPAHDVGGNIRMAAVLDPAGYVFGLIENPEFVVRDVESAGPGR